MRGRVVYEDPRAVPETRRAAPGREREDRDKEGRERAWGEVTRPLTFRDRSERALADVGIYRLVPFRELAEAHFGGKQITARRAVNAWIREGLAREITAENANGRPFTILSLTRQGASVARDVVAGQGLDPAQEFTCALRIRHANLAHDAAIYRAARRERERLAREGRRVRRVRLEGELKATVLRRIQLARVSGGQRAADSARLRTAAELGLPIDAEGRVLYPDAQIEYVDAGGTTGRVNVEIASGHYREASIRAKADAGFRMYANGAAAARTLGMLRTGGPGL